MVTPEELAALDLLIWLRTGQAAATRTGVNQSTMARRASAAAAVFGIKPKRVNGEWTLTGNGLLLAMEREVHQYHRLFGGAPLRLECTPWDVQALALPVPPGWIGGVFDHMTMARPLQLLRERVIDAWINNCAPDLPDEEDPELLVVPLSRFPVWLMAAADHPLAGAAGLSDGDLERFPSMALPKGELPTFERVLRGQGLWNTPLRMRRYNVDDWEDRCSDRVTMSFGNCVSQRMTPHLTALDWDLTLVSGQSVVVRRDIAETGPILNLLDVLRRRTAALQSTHPMLELV